MLTASEVVCSVGVSCAGMPTPSVPIYAHRRRQCCSACASSHAQVVLPLVPVMPATVICCAGAPPKWTTMNAARVHPPALPPLTPPDGDRFAESDLDHLSTLVTIQNHLHH